MEDAMKELLKNSPLAGVVLFIVVIFVRYLSKISDNAAKERMTNEEFLARLHNEHINERQLSRLTVAENNALLRENTKALTALTSQLERR